MFVYLKLFNKLILLNSKFHLNSFLSKNIFFFKFLELELNLQIL